MSRFLAKWAFPGIFIVALVAWLLITEKEFRREKESAEATPVPDSVCTFDSGIDRSAPHRVCVATFVRNNRAITQRQCWLGNTGIYRRTAISCPNGFEQGVRGVIGQGRHLIILDLGRYQASVTPLPLVVSSASAGRALAARDCRTIRVRRGLFDSMAVSNPVFHFERNRSVIIIDEPHRSEDVGSPLVCKFGNQEAVVGTMMETLRFSPDNRARFSLLAEDEEYLRDNFRR